MLRQGRAVSIAILTVAALCAAPAAAGADTLFRYRGHRLHPLSGNGVPGVIRLQFTLSGQMPERGSCRTDPGIVSVSDGGYSLKQALEDGFGVSHGSHARLCADRKGTLRAELFLSLERHSGGVLDAEYSWSSHDPGRSGSADTVILYANVEYHVSGARWPGHLSAGSANEGRSGAARSGLAEVQSPSP